VTIEMVFLDIGGVLYGDAVYGRALLAAFRELGADPTNEAFAEAYEECRRTQAGSFRRRLTARFLGSDHPIGPVEERAAAHWDYGPDDLEPDVVPALDRLAGRYRLGLIANQPGKVRAAMDRDGLSPYFEVWGVSGDVGFEKPDPRLYAHVLYVAGVAPDRSVMVGDRLDYDVRPARTAGMRTVWVLRGEAPREPTPAQLAEADAAIRGLDELPAVVAGFDRR
jgi:HAD superfamily hydrolase (TIGR01509 family)